MTHASLSFLFGLDDGNVGRNINPLRPLLAGAFRIPERRVELEADEVRELFFDATEQPRDRPGRGQAAYYSGKRERQAVVDPRGNSAVAVEHAGVTNARSRPSAVIAGRLPIGGRPCTPRPSACRVRRRRRPTAGGTRTAASAGGRASGR